jgi:hypothetical protein
MDNRRAVCAVKLAVAVPLLAARREHPSRRAVAVQPSIGVSPLEDAVVVHLGHNLTFTLEYVSSNPRLSLPAGDWA